MNILIFLLILIVLILVHEYGHFISAKFFKMRVDEFGIGYPPRAFKLGKYKDTLFSVNWIPFGGFVKIFGEQKEDELDKNPDAFYSKPKINQAVVLISGVLANFILAWFLFSASFMIGTPAVVRVDDPNIFNPRLIITSVFENTPASDSGLSPGDAILEVNISGQILNPSLPEDFQAIIGSSSGEEIKILVNRGRIEKEIIVTPKYNEKEGKSFIGVSIDRIGEKKLGFIDSILEGLKTSVSITFATLKAFWDLLSGAFLGTADLSQLTGPVGIVKAVGTAAGFGISYLLSFTALISINLVIINLLPIPALDGGRLLFLVIEAIRGRDIKLKTAYIANTIGFVLLILLMLVVTFNDIKNLF